MIDPEEQEEYIAFCAGMEYGLGGGILLGIILTLLYLYFTGN